MSSKRLFSWSKRQSNAEPYYKTGGLLSIDALGIESGNDHEAKVRVNCRMTETELAMRNVQCASTWSRRAEWWSSLSAQVCSGPLQDASTL